MRKVSLALAALLAGVVPVVGQVEWLRSDETLTYNVNWPSGLALGEARMHVVKVKGPEGSQDRWSLEFTIDANIPGFGAADRFRSLATLEFCSLEFEKDSTHGEKITRELTTFNQTAHTALRETKGGGGKSRLQIPPCAKDALTFLYFMRGELAQGRLAASQTVYFGGPYQVRLEYAGREKVTIGAQEVETDHLKVSAKGKASDTTFEIFVSQDQARRPVLVRVPLELGVMSMELVP